MVLGLCALIAPVSAQTPDGRTPSLSLLRDPGRYALPTGPWSEEFGIPRQVVEGAVSIRAYRFAAQNQTPVAAVAPLRTQLRDAGFEIVLDCAARRCGGFDFRFGLEVLPAPAMFVRLDHYHFVSARRDAQAVTLLASRDAENMYLQITEIAPPGTPLVLAPPPEDTSPAGTQEAPAQAAATTTSVPETTSATAPANADLISRIERHGHAVLEDLAFASGASALIEGRYETLDALAAYLRQSPSRQILFVGHTDSVGSLSANRRLSRRRAEAVVSYMRQTHDIPARQIAGEGAGYLAPRATNLDEVGRTANRRVEAVLLSQ